MNAESLSLETLRATLGGHDVVASVQPNCGGNLVSLQVDGQEYLHYDEAAMLRDGAFSGCFVMFPTPCRVPDGVYCFDGRSIVQRKRGRLITIHGLVRDEAFQCTRDASSLNLTLAITPDHPVYEGFPFRSTLRIRMRIIERGLEYRFEFHNEDDRPAPVGFGLHPFWSIHSHRKDVYVQTPCDRTMVLENLVPTGETMPVAGTPLDLRQPRCLEGLELDGVFLRGDTHAPAVIEYRDLGTRMCLYADDTFSHQIVYAPSGKPFVCVECLTTAPNAVNMPFVPADISGLRIVPPGETLSGIVRMVVDDLA